MGQAASQRHRGEDIHESEWRDWVRQYLRGLEAQIAAVRGLETRVAALEGKRREHEVGLRVGRPWEAEIVESLLGMPPANATRQLLYLKRHARARGGPRSLTRVPPPASGGLGGSHEVSESRGSHGNHQGNAPPWGDDARMTEWLSQHS